jgi:hypothetical protein
LLPLFSRIIGAAANEEARDKPWWKVTREYSFQALLTRSNQMDVLCSALMFFMKMT